jgi:hypothetical protein
MSEFFLFSRNAGFGSPGNAALIFCNFFIKKKVEKTSRKAR